MLNNEVYPGKLIYGKQKNKSMKSKQKVRCPREDWVIVENCHESIVTQKLWDSAHRMLDGKRRPTQTGEVQMFAGLLYCADCGHALVYSQRKRKDGSYHGAYSCWMYKTHGKEYCASNYITYDVVYELVLKDVRRVLKSFRKDKQAFEEYLNSHFSDSSGRRLKALESDLEHRLERITEIGRVLDKLYEDNALSRISDERYEQMTQSYSTEQEELRKSIPEARAEIATLKAKTDAADRFISVIDKFTDVKEFNAEILNELIDKIVIHHKEKVGGRIYQQVEIYYRFVGELRETAEKAA